MRAAPRVDTSVGGALALELDASAAISGCTGCTVRFLVALPTRTLLGIACIFRLSARRLRTARAALWEGLRLDQCSIRIADRAEHTQRRGRRRYLVWPWRGWRGFSLCLLYTSPS